MLDLSKFKNSNVQTSVRFPENIYNKLKKLAKDNDMSFNKKVAFRLLFIFIFYLFTCNNNSI